mmetsp:Transcript_46256/g.92332  ORF Transcript_46256/g.92332 Transcript_46256/m.92332 type:complete len:256 (+) Transcript_46256:160-927(+)
MRRAPPLRLPISRSISQSPWVAMAEMQCEVYTQSLSWSKQCRSQSGPGERASRTCGARRPPHQRCSVHAPFGWAHRRGATWQPAQRWSSRRDHGPRSGEVTARSRDHRRDQARSREIRRHGWTSRREPGLRNGFGMKRREALTMTLTPRPAARLDRAISQSRPAARLTSLSEPLAARCDGALAYRRSSSPLRRHRARAMEPPPMQVSHQGRGKAQHAARAGPHYLPILPPPCMFTTAACIYMTAARRGLMASDAH